MSYVCARCASRSSGRANMLARASTSRTVSHNRQQSNIQRRGFHMAVLGSGPAGFYAAGKVMREIPNAKVDMYERLPIPFGLVRYGVAPDHPEVKNCQDRFTEIAASPNFDFIGNIEVGKDVPLSLLKENYDAILFSYGASEDRKLGLPGEDLPGVYSARDFVAWYNGLPGATDLQPRISEGTEAVVIGQGNVALDIARILLTDVDTLRKTDIPEYALEALSRSKISSVRVVGRRGPLQAAFTIKEVREIAHISNLHFSDVPKHLFPRDLKTLPRPRKRIAELLLKSGQGPRSACSPGQKSFSFDFLLNPSAFNGSSHLESMSFNRTQYVDGSKLADPFASIKVDEQASPITLPAAAAFRSIGYKAKPIHGMDELGVPFDNKKGIILNEGGRIFTNHDQASPEHDAQREFAPGLYVAGWVKRGPTGVIASTMEEAFQTADSIIEDHRTVDQTNSSNKTSLGWQSVQKPLQHTDIRRTSWRDWLRLNEVERERGAALGKEREKIVSTKDMMKVLDQ